MNKEKLISTRNSILDKAVAYFSKTPGVEAMFLNGSLADESHDQFSDIDLRIVFSDDKYEEGLSGRREAPEKWGDFLFHETVGSFWTVSYYKPFNKIDVFYYKSTEFEPSPWMSLAVKIILDKKGQLKEIVEQSSELEFIYPLEQQQQLLNKATATFQESIKRLLRGELIYAQYMAVSLISQLISLDDIKNKRPSYGVSKFEKRASKELLEEFYSIELNYTAKELSQGLLKIGQLLKKSVERVSDNKLLYAVDYGILALGESYGK